MAPLYGASASPGPSPRSAAGRDGSPINDRVLFRRFHPACIHMMQPRLGQGSHHPTTLVSGAGVPPHCLEAVYFRLQAAQVVSDCFWRHVHSNYLLVAEYAYGPPPGSAHFLSSLIESSRS